MKRLDYACGGMLKALLNPQETKESNAGGHKHTHFCGLIHRPLPTASAQPYKQFHASKSPTKPPNKKQAITQKSNILIWSKNYDTDLPLLGTPNPSPLYSLCIEFLIASK
jgi:hypothetical protein